MASGMPQRIPVTRSFASNGNFSVRNPAPQVIRPRARRTEPRTATGTRPAIDTDCTFEQTAQKGDKGDKGDTGKTGPEGPQGPAGPPGQVTEEHLAMVVAAVVAQLKADPAMKGSDGQDGRDGKDAVIDYDRLANEVIRRLPPITVQQLDEKGKMLQEGDAYLGGTLRLYHASRQPYLPES